MNTFEEYLQTIKNEEHATKLTNLIKWISETFPQLKLKIAWNQPMLCDHDSFIIGFSVSSKHLSIALEKQILAVFIEKIETANYTHGKNIFRILWQDSVDYELLKMMINYSMQIKKDCSTFWLKD